MPRLSCLPRTFLFFTSLWFAAVLTACVPVQAPSPQATAAPLTAFTAPLPIPAPQDVRLSGDLSSPDGAWTASYVAAFPAGRAEYYQRLVVRATDGNPRYVVVDGWSPLGLGYTVAIPLQWSDDSERLYYTNRPTPDGCGVLVNGSDLHMVDVSQGIQRQLLPPLGGVIGLAPDETHVAYRPWGAPGLTIQNLETGAIKSVQLEAIIDDGALGALTWSPDSDTLAFVVAHYPCAGAWARSTSIYTLDHASLALTPHLVRDARVLVPVSWQGDGVLRLETAEGDPFTLDLADNRVTAIPPTH